jgi:hypothetical protein
MIKKACSYFSIFILCIAVSGCVRAQVALLTAQVAHKLGSSDSSNSYIFLGVYEYGKYQVKVRENDSTCEFELYNYQPEVILALLNKKSPEEGKMVDDFKQMDKTGKKKFIKDLYLKRNNIDLGPIEPETAEVEKAKDTTVPTPSSTTK